MQVCASVSRFASLFFEQANGIFWGFVLLVGEGMQPWKPILVPRQNCCFMIKKIVHFIKTGKIILACSLVGVERFEDVCAHLP